MGVLENIRNKPHETRIKIVWTICAVVIVILLVLWVLVGRMELDPNRSVIGQILDRVGHPSQTFSGIFKRQ